ncbi:MAG: acylphosphatase [Humibacillus sp.]
MSTRGAMAAYRVVMGSDETLDDGPSRRPIHPPSDARSQADPVRATFFVHGDVQGVGFRWWARARALELGLVGHARNTADGRVEVVAQGPAASVDHLECLLGEDPSSRCRPGRVRQVVGQRGEPKDGISGFVER